MNKTSILWLPLLLCGCVAGFLSSCADVVSNVPNAKTSSAIELVVIQKTEAASQVDIIPATKNQVIAY